MLASFKYFKPADSVLPKPDDPLSIVVPQQALNLLTKKVKRELDKHQTEKKKPAAKRST